MKLFCRLLGHTWVAKADSPKTRWNVDKTGLLLVPTPDGSPRFYDECARCREQREARPPRK